MLIEFNFSSSVKIIKFIFDDQKSLTESQVSTYLASYGLEVSFSSAEPVLSIQLTTSDLNYAKIALSIKTFFSQTFDQRDYLLVEKILEQIGTKNNSIQKSYRIFPPLVSSLPISSASTGQPFHSEIKTTTAITNTPVLDAKTQEINQPYVIETHSELNNSIFGGIEDQNHMDNILKNIKANLIKKTNTDTAKQIIFAALAYLDENNETLLICAVNIRRFESLEKILAFIVDNFTRTQLIFLLNIPNKYGYSLLDILATHPFAQETPKQIKTRLELINKIGAYPEILFSRIPHFTNAPIHAFQMNKYAELQQFNHCLLSAISTQENTRLELVSNLKRMPPHIKASYLEATNSDDYTALRLAIAKKDEKMALVLIDIMQDLDPSSQNSILIKHIKYNKDKNKDKDNLRDTPLTLALRNGLFDTANQFIDLGKKLSVYHGQINAINDIKRATSLNRLIEISHHISELAKYLDVAPEIIQLTNDFIQRLTSLVPQIIASAAALPSSTAAFIELANKLSSYSISFSSKIIQPTAFPVEIISLAKQLRNYTSHINNEMVRLAYETEMLRHTHISLCLGTYLAPAAYDGHNALTLTISANDENRAIKFFQEIKQLSFRDQFCILTSAIKPDGHTALTLAVTKGFFNLATEIILLVKNISQNESYYLKSILNAKNSNGFTALTILYSMKNDTTIHHNKNQFRKLIKDLEAFPEVCSLHNNTQLCEVAKNGNVPGIVRCLEADADLMYTNMDILTPLMLAAQNGHVTAMGVLLNSLTTPEGKPDIKKQFIYLHSRPLGLTALSHAISADQFDSVRFLARQMHHKAIKFELNKYLEQNKGLTPDQQPKHFKEIGDFLTKILSSKLQSSQPVQATFAAKVTTNQEEKNTEAIDLDKLSNLTETEKEQDREASIADEDEAQNETPDTDIFQPPAYRL